jgi:hypothetical protein
VGEALVIAVVVIAVLAQLVGSWREIQKEAARRARGGQPQRPPQAGGQLEDEIAEFLRRKASGKEQAPSGQSASPPLARPLAPAEPVRPFRPPPAPSPPLVREEPVVAEIVVVPAKREERFSQRVGDRSRRPPPLEVTLVRPVAVGAPIVEEPTRPVAEPSVPADRMAAPPAVSAATVAELLANPASLRQAVLLSEILHRPEERWR